MLDFIVAVTCLFTQVDELPKPDYSIFPYIEVCNTYLDKSSGRDPVAFVVDIPESYHKTLIYEAAKAGWILDIKPIVGIYDWEYTYQFTFTPLNKKDDYVETCK